MASSDLSSGVNVPAGSAEKLQQLYELLYGLSEKPEIIFDMLLKSKEEFAEECYRSVLADHVLPIIS